MADHTKNPWEIIRSSYALFGRSKLISEKINAINQIANNYSPQSSIPYLFPLLLGNEFQEVKDEAAKSIPILMKKMLKEHNNVISQGCTDYFRYINLTVSNVSLLCAYKHPGILLGIASLNGNGYVREAALDQFGSIDENWSFLLPFLLARLNDHIEIIREKAKTYLESVLPKCSLDDILCNSEAFTHYDKGMRTESINLQHMVSPYIRKTSCLTLINSLGQWPARVQVFIIKSLLEEIGQKKDLLIEKILMHADPSAKQWFIKATSAWEFPISLIEQMLKDLSSLIRQAAIRQIKLESIETFKKEIGMLTYDRTRRVRDSARYWARSKGIIDNIRSHYFYTLENFENPPIGLLVGLMEVAEEQDVVRIKLYLSHSHTDVRAAALATLYRLKGNEVIEIALNSLLDKSASVRKIAKIILKNSSSIYDEQIRSYLFNGPEYAKQACFGILISRKNFYTLKNILVILNNAEEETLINQGWGALINWYRYALPSLYSFPEKALYEDILQIIDEIENTHKKIPIQVDSSWKSIKNTIRMIGSKFP